MINNSCSKHFSYKDIIECGETWTKYRYIISNNPTENDTYNSIKLLCMTLLDPIVDHFGKINLTYGFSSMKLTKLIKGRIYPLTDQHSGHEKKKNGEYICNRLGQAVDFKILGVDSRDVSNWIIKSELPFDRLYFYDSKKPIHLSVGPDNKRQSIKMISYNKKNLVPKVVKCF